MYLRLVAEKMGLTRRRDFVGLGERGGSGDTDDSDREEGSDDGGELHFERWIWWGLEV